MSLHAHNAVFERLITWHVLPRYVQFQKPSIDAYYCTMGQAQARSYPAKLDKLAPCLGLNIKKDPRGNALIRRLSVPQYFDENGNLV